MASLIKKDSKSHEESNDGLNKISSHPMFQDLQATLASECFQASVPYTLCSDENISSADTEVVLDPSFVAVQEAHLQCQFQTLSGDNTKVRELQNFYSTKCAEIETQRCDAIAKLKGQIFHEETLYQTELYNVHTFHDRQRMHLTSRISTSLELLKVSLPDSCSVNSSKQTKSRQLNARAVEIMTEWFERNIDNPYPSESDKEKMADDGGISLGQVKAWFANKRNRTSNTKPKKQKQQVEKKLLTICSELTSGDNKTPRLYGDIIQKLSNIINRSTVFNQGTPIFNQGIMLDPNNSYLNPGMAMFSQRLPVVDTTVSSSDDNSNGST